ncbi:hypothetical protein A0H81_10733 [Grifola frondosa]|uniref:Fanconi-associated nuclease 1-like winged-helix domain-containing protein n=1 Tax=Grifola frondosa TaxID=5627 RepID=A0A1C7LYN8_GRIFR|nr:hypothetical protein A0H81_10733 [Grifola frondosa]
MSLLGSPSSSSMGKLVFWYQVEDETFPAKRESDPDAGLGSVEDTKAVVAKEASMYVSLFEDMLKILLYNEHFLFSQEELQCFTNYSNLTYNARYLLLRLCLRKTDKWHRLGALHYEQELGDAIPTAIQELCSSRGLLCANEEEDIKPKSKDNVKVKQEVIDLTLDDYDKQPVPGPSTICPIKCEPTPDVKLEPDYSVFAEDQNMLHCMSFSSV